MPLKQYQKYLVYALPILLIGLICYYFFDIVTYIALAWILAMIGAPLHARLRKFIGNSGAAIVTLISFGVVAFALFWIFIPPIVQQARNFTNIDYEAVATSLEEPIKDWEDWLINKGILEDQKAIDSIETVERNEKQKPYVEVVKVDSILKQGITDSSHQSIAIVLQINQPKDINSDEHLKTELLNDSFIDRMKKNALSFINPTRVTNILSTIFGALGNTLIGIMSVFFICFFFLKEQGLFTSMVRSVSPNDQEDKWTHAIDESADLLKRYFIGIVIQIFIITIIVSTSLSILGFKNALLIGFFAALMNVIPYIGPILGASFAIIITIASSLDNTGVIAEAGQTIVQGGFYDTLLPKIGILALVFAGMQMFDNFIVQPNIFSKSVKAHPLEIFIIILVGAKLGGVLGMVLAIPLYTILRVLAKVFLSEFKVVQKLTQDI